MHCVDVEKAECRHWRARKVLSPRLELQVFICAGSGLYKEGAHMSQRDAQWKEFLAHFLSITHRKIVGRRPARARPLKATEKEKKKNMRDLLMSSRS